MELSEFQKFAKKAVRPGVNVEIITLGLAGETGEVVDIIKKGLISGTIVKSHLIEELGDVLWYLSNLCTTFNIDLNVVAEANIIKLKSRYNALYKDCKHED